MTNERKAAAELLSSVRRAIKTSEKLMASKNEKFSAFGLKMFAVLAEFEIALLDILGMNPQREDGNPLARRVKVDG